MKICPLDADTVGRNTATLSGANGVATNLSIGAGLAWCSVIERHLAIIAILANATFRKLPVATDTIGRNAATLCGTSGIATNLSRGAGVAWWRVIERHLAIRAILADAPFKILPVIAGNKHTGAPTGTRTGALTGTRTGTSTGTRTGTSTWLLRRR
jgi:hypothetical protein